MFPFDDHHRYHRPAALVSASWGGKLQERLEFLSPTPEIEVPQNSKFSKADIATMNAMMQMAGKK